MFGFEYPKVSPGRQSENGIEEAHIVPMQNNHIHKS
jgi:hypothetical protein